MTEVTLSQHVLDALGPAIVNGESPPGTVFRIEDLESRFGVSRTVVRDALRTLESMNMVESRRSVGATVASPERWDVFAREIIRWRLASENYRKQLTSLTQLRAAIEPVAAGLAARQPEHENLGVELLGLLPHANDEAGFVGALERDIGFHCFILKRCGNEMMAALSHVVEQVLRARHDLHLRPNRPHEVPVLLHTLVATAIRDGDAVTAESAMRHLVAEVIHDVQRTTAERVSEV